MVRGVFGLCLLIAASSLCYAQPPFGRGGGGRGGDGRGGDGRGGFDPSSFLSRMDQNGNGVIDPDEQQGGAKFLIGRLSSYDSSIREGVPIPVNKFVEAFNKMRESGGGRGGRPDGGGDDRRGRDDDDRRGRDDRGDDRGSRREREDEALATEPLVPGFGNDDLPPMLIGFGAAAEIMNNNYSEEDLREANERIKAFDKNKNGYIDAEELNARFSGSPMDFDINRDGRLSAVELAVRQARKRDYQSSQSSPKPERRAKNSDQDLTQLDLFNGRRSYRPTSRRATPEGVPGFFSDKDADSDGQVTMAEYGSDWTDEMVAQFNEYDFDGDGVITADEALRSVEEGTVSQIMTAGSSGTAAVASPATDEVPADINPKYVQYAKRIIDRNDQNGDGVLTPSEMQKMLLNPSGADANRDGKVSLGEYAGYLQNKDRR